MFLVFLFWPLCGNKRTSNFPPILPGATRAQLLIRIIRLVRKAKSLEPSPFLTCAYAVTQ